MSAWDASLMVVIISAGIAAVAAALRSRPGRWRAAPMVAGVVVVVLALSTPLEADGRDGLLTAHVAQHILLGDVAAALLVLGLPMAARKAADRRLRALGESPSRSARLAARLPTPLVAFGIWTTVIYLWFLPAMHQAAIPVGLAHLADHACFLLIGMLLWFNVFDPRSGRSAGEGLKFGGMPWWGRHLYAMVTRTVLLVPAVVIWVAAPAVYHPSGSWPFKTDQTTDSSNAASLMLGFEMTIFGLAIVLGAVFLIAHEHETGHRAT